MQAPHPERKPPPLPASPDGQPNPTPAATSASETLLLRICGLLLGSTLLVILGLTLLVIFLKGPNSPAAAPAEQTMASPEKEMPPLDPKTATNDRRPEEVAQVLGEGFHAPPLPPPPAIAPQSSPPPSAPPKIPSADDALEQRLQSSPEDLRKELLAVPELRLFSDLIVQNFREKEQNDERTVKGMSREQIDFAYNTQMHKYMREAGLGEGLPLSSGPNCQLDADTAMLVQTVSNDLRDLGLVSVPGAPARGRLKSSGKGGTAAQNGSSLGKIEAFREWCDVNTIEKFRGALATLLQVLQVEDVPMRLLLVRELDKAQGPSFTAALATAALVDLAPEVRQAAVSALEKRPSEQYVSVLLEGLRYPWAPVADHAAVALRKLKPRGVVPKLIALLDRPDPSLPHLDPRTKKPVVRELVRLNHLRNCLLCHAPSANDKDGLVRGLVPTPGQPLPRLYYKGQKGNYVRADLTFLRQDFSTNLTVGASAPWPSEQRFDFMTRVRPAKPEEMAKSAVKPGNYPQRDAVLYALRGLTGKDGGEASTNWLTLLGISKDTK